MPHTAAGLDPDRPDASPMDVETDDVCWICLDDKKLCQDLLSPCKCPRKVHPRCMARWQLQQAGRAEETHCRFCNSTLADWKASLTPDALKPEVEKVQPIMVVYFEGEIHRIPVRQGDEGLKEFTSRIRELFKLPPEVDISLTFGCKEPMSGHHLKLEGMGAFDAAVHCASVAAAERQHKAGQRTTNGRLEEGPESSDEGEDTTDLLQSTLGGPIQRPPGNRAGALAAAIPPVPVPVPNPGHQANRPRFSPAAAHVDSPRGPHTPRGSSTPTSTTSTRLPSARTASQRQQAQAASPLQHTHDNLQPRYQYPPRTPPAADWRTTMLADPAPNGVRRTNALPPSDVTHGQDNFNARNTVQERIRELERLASRIPRSSGSTRSPTTSTGGNNVPPQILNQAGPNIGDDLSTQRRVRRTSSRNQRATAESLNHQGHDSIGGSDPMDVDDAPVAVGTLETAGGPGSSAGSLGPSSGKRQGGPGQINYDVPPNAISRSKLNQVLSFFGIRPPVQYTLGSTVTMDE